MREILTDHCNILQLETLRAENELREVTRRFSTTKWSVMALFGWFHDFFHYGLFFIGCYCQRVIISVAIIVIFYSWKCSELRTSYGKLLDGLGPQNRWLWRYLVDSAPLSLFQSFLLCLSVAAIPLDDRISAQISWKEASTGFVRQQKTRRSEPRNCLSIFSIRVTPQPHTMLG